MTSLVRNASTISWIPPPSLDLDVVYCVEVYNITCGRRDLIISVCNVTEPSYTSDDIAPDGYIYEYTVTPRSNVEGARNGTSLTVTGVFCGAPKVVFNNPMIYNSEKDTIGSACDRSSATVTVVTVLTKVVEAPFYLIGWFTQYALKCTIYTLKIIAINDMILNVTSASTIHFALRNCDLGTILCGL